MDEKLFQEFPPVPTEQWEEIILKDLKGADYEKKLVWNTLEGFKVKPYYRSEHLKDLDFLKVLPGNFPYIRGTNPKAYRPVRQDVIVSNPLEDNKFLHKLLNSGVESLGLIFEKELSKNNFFKLLEGLNPEKVEINLIPETLTGKYVEYLIEFCKENSFDLSKVRGSNEYDSFGYILLNGKTFCNSKNCNCAIDYVKAYIDLLPNFKLITINAKHFHNCGGTAVQELAFGISMAAEYLKLLVENGIAVSKAASTLRFNFAAGSNYFMEIAKLRAAKLIWAKVMEANGEKDNDCSKINIHCETSYWNKTIYDPYVNMLRVTTEAMAAIIGGADSVNVLPYDITLGKPTDFSLRIARNVQIILKEEANIDKVIDPSAGSYFIENLTNSIIEHSWKKFIEIEEVGGFMNTLSEGKIQDEINATAQKRKQNVATRQEIVLGTNQYPNFTETHPEAKLPEIKEPIGKDFKTIRIARASEEFEILRIKTDKSGKRPKAFMLTIGNLTFRKARAQFSCNFFACAGFEVIDNNGFESIEAGIEAARKAGAEIIVLCSSDDEYAELAPKAFEKIEDEIFVVAGNPACRAELEEKGIKNFIHIKSNVLEELKNYQKLLGIN